MWVVVFSSSCSCSWMCRETTGQLYKGDTRLHSCGTVVSRWWSPWSNFGVFVFFRHRLAHCPCRCQRRHSNCNNTPGGNGNRIDLCESHHQSHHRPISSSMIMPTIGLVVVGLRYSVLLCLFSRVRTALIACPFRKPHQVPRPNPAGPPYL